MIKTILSKIPKVNACTLWPDKFGNYDLTAACLAHDEDYVNRVGWLNANKMLRKRVSKAMNPVMGWIMWTGVSSPVGLILYGLSSGVEGIGD
jgi:hypothetical protein